MAFSAAEEQLLQVWPSCAGARPSEKKSFDTRHHLVGAPLSSSVSTVLIMAQVLAVDAGALDEQRLSKL